MKNEGLRSINRMQYLMASGYPRHLKTHAEKIVACSQCDKTFSSKENLQKHVTNVHTENSKKPVHCPKCGKGFISNQVLEGHMNMHLGLKPYKCDLCETSFQNPSNKLAHMKKVHHIFPSKSK